MATIYKPAFRMSLDELKKVSEIYSPGSITRNDLSFPEWVPHKLFWTGYLYNSLELWIILDPADPIFILPFT